MANNTIALLARPAELDPFEVPAKQAALRSLAMKQAGDELELQAAHQAAADNEAQRAALAADPSGGDGYLKALAKAGNVKGYFAGVKANADLAKTRAETDKDKATASKTALDALNLRTARYRDALNNVGDQASAAAWVQSMYADPDIGKIIASELGPVDAAIARIPNPATDPQGFAAWKRGSQLGAEKFVEIFTPKPGQRDLGDRVENTLVDPATGKVTVTGTARKGQSPDSVASNATQRRGQDMVDRRERELGPGGPGGRAPTGYRWNAAGTALEPIPGGPAGRTATATEGERKAATLLTRLQGSQQQLVDALGLDPEAAKPGLLANGLRAMGAETIANSMTGERRQQIESAQLDILDAALTLGTGAAYTREQLEGYRKSYFPQIGDKPANIADKAARLETVLKAAEIAAGRAAATVPNPTRGGPNPGTVEDGYRFKGGDASKPENWERI